MSTTVIETIDTLAITAAEAKKHRIVGPKALEYKPKVSHKPARASRPRIVERDPTVIRARLEAEIMKNADRMGSRAGRDYVGKLGAPNYLISATDGHRALLVSGSGEAGPGKTEFRNDRKYSAVLERDFGERLLEVSLRE